MDLTQIMKDYGIWAALAIYLIYQSRKDARVDYQGVCARLNEVEDYVRTTLTNLVKDTHEVMESAKAEMRQNRQSIIRELQRTNEKRKDESKDSN